MENKSYIDALHSICDAFMKLKGVEDYDNQAKTYIECFKELVVCLYEVNGLETPDFEGVETYRDWMTELVKIIFIMNESEVPEYLKIESYNDVLKGLIDAYTDLDVETIPNKNIYLECLKALLSAIYASVNITDYEEFDDVTMQECLYRIAEAIEATSDALGETIEVNEETVETIEVAEGETKNIKLAGKNITTNIINNGSLIISGEGTFVSTNDNTLTNNGKLFIKGGTFDCQTKGKSALLNKTGGEVTINDGYFVRNMEFTGDYSKSDPNAYYTIQNHGKMTINGGTFESLGGNASMIENGFYDAEKENTDGSEPTLIINGGTFKGGINTIKNDECGILEINGGEISNDLVFGEKRYSAILNWNKCTINNGIITSATCTICNGTWGDNAVGELTINGGTYSCGDNFEILIQNSQSKLGMGTTKITGGTFNGTLGIEEVLKQIEM